MSQLACGFVVSSVLLCLTACGGGSHPTSTSRPRPPLSRPSRRRALPPRLPPARHRNVARQCWVREITAQPLPGRQAAALSALAGFSLRQPRPGNVTVMATSTQDKTKSGTAAVAVQATGSTITSVSVACNPAIGKHQRNLAVQCDREGLREFQLGSHMVNKRRHSQRGRPLHCTSSSGRSDDNRDKCSGCVEVGYCDRYGAIADGAEQAHRHGA